MQQNIIYNRQFRGNVLIAGKTGRGKIYFIQKLAINNFLVGKLERPDGYRLSS